MTRLTGPSPRVHLSNYHAARSAIAAMLLLSIACNISAIGNAVERGDAFKEVVEQTNEEGKRMEKEYPPGDTLPAGDLGSPVDPPLAPPPAAVASSPPALTGLQFPAEIPGDGTPKGGWFTFTDLGGDCTRAVFSVVSATNFAGFEFNPHETLTSGDYYAGTSEFNIWCEGSQTVTLRATLYDEAGAASNSRDITFTCKE